VWWRDTSAQYAGAIVSRLRPAFDAYLTLSSVICSLRCSLSNARTAYAVILCKEASRVHRGAIIGRVYPGRCADCG
jgi:hypothetical protein